jgi:hypothetical protein
MSVVNFLSLFSTNDSRAFYLIITAFMYKVVVVVVVCVCLSVTS